MQSRKPSRLRLSVADVAGCAIEIPGCSIHSSRNKTPNGVPGKKKSGYPQPKEMVQIWIKRTCWKQIVQMCNYQSKKQIGIPAFQTLHCSAVYHPARSWSQYMVGYGRYGYTTHHGHPAPTMEASKSTGIFRKRRQHSEHLVITLTSSCP